MASEPEQSTYIEAEDKSNTHAYFIMLPQAVKYQCATVYELSLWVTIMEVAGEGGYCQIGTHKLAAMAGMSIGALDKARKALLRKGLLQGRKIKPPGLERAVWRLTIPDRWGEWIAWRKRHNTIDERVTFRKEQRRIVRQANNMNKRSPDERSCSPGEISSSSGRKKEDPLRRTKEELDRRETEEIDLAVHTWQATLAELELQMTHAAFGTWLRPLTPYRLIQHDPPTEDGVTHTLQIIAPNAYVVDWCTGRLDAPIGRTVAGILGIRVAELALEYVVGEVEIYEPDDLPLLQQQPAEMRN